MIQKNIPAYYIKSILNIFSSLMRINYLTVLNKILQEK